jgi:hypothetical protein
MAESGNNSAAMLASQPMKVENISMPGFGGQNTNKFDLTKYRVRYGKYDLDDSGAVAELELLETAGLQGKEIVVLQKEKFTFMQQFFLVVTYLELVQTV